MRSGAHRNIAPPHGRQIAVQQPRAHFRIAEGRCHPQDLQFRAFQRQRQRKRIIDVVADVGIDNDHLRCRCDFSCIGRNLRSRRRKCHKHNPHCQQNHQEPRNFHAKYSIASAWSITLWTVVFRCPCRNNPALHAAASCNSPDLPALPALYLQTSSLLWPGRCRVQPSGIGRHSFRARFTRCRSDRFVLRVGCVASSRFRPMDSAGIWTKPGPTWVRTAAGWEEPANRGSAARTILMAWSRWPICWTMPALKAKAQRYIDWTLDHQAPNGNDRPGVERRLVAAHCRCSRRSRNTTSSPAIRA